MAKKDSRPTLLRNRNGASGPGHLIDYEQGEANGCLARKIYALRTKAGLTQEALGRLVGTTGSVISRLEDASYDGHSLGMLRRIARVLNRRVEVRFVPLRILNPSHQKEGNHATR